MESWETKIFRRKNFYGGNSIVNKQTAIDIHLKALDSVGFNGKIYFSCLGQALKDARKASGRNENSGDLDRLEGSHSWLGAIAYLMLVDQIGECYKNPAKGESSYSIPFRKALHYFSDLTQSDNKVLYGLRSSLVHNYSLVSRFRRDPNDPWDYCYVFGLQADSNSPLIIPPNEKWRGDISLIEREKHSTTITLRKVGDLVEKMYKYIIDLHGKGQLEITMDPEELVKCFTFSVYDSTPPSGR